jgi:hypothetical protein
MGANIPVTEDEERQILQLLRAGHNASRVAAMVGRSWRVAARIRDAHRIAPHDAGVPPRYPQPEQEPSEEDGLGLADPWVPPADWDLFVERPNQQRWRAMCEAASPAERDRLRTAMCRVLGLPPIASDAEVIAALVAERRQADELAGLYAAARGEMQGWTP